MKILEHYIIYDADDEEPDCMMCDHCQSGYFCESCGPEHWWYYYARTEKDSEKNKLYEALERLGLKK